VLSGSDDLRDVRRVLDVGAMGFIPKKETAPVMLSALRLVLAGGIYIPPMLMNSTAGVTTVAEAALTPRQLEVLKYLAEGKSNKEIGREMDLSEATIKVHTVAIFRNLKVSNRTEAVRIGTQRGLLATAR
jgi:DNA-binding NarL/FixJ family response regulator